MDNMQQKLDSILSNPEMMSQIMNMAQALGAKPEPDPVQETAPAPSFGGMDMGMMQKIASVAGQAGIDRNQQNLLQALRPYLTEHRILKLEKAMRAAKIAGLATTFLGSADGFLFSGR